MSPIRIQRRRTKGWRMPENTVYVGRGSRWGNPYVVEQVGRKPGHDWIVTLDHQDQVFRHVWRLNAVREAVVMFRRALTRGWHGLDPDVSTLAGKDLACWCPLDQPCHADVLLELANAKEDGDE